MLRKHSLSSSLSSRWYTYVLCETIYLSRGPLGLTIALAIAQIWARIGRHPRSVHYYSTYWTSSKKNKQPDQTHSSLVSRSQTKTILCYYSGGGKHVSPCANKPVDSFSRRDRQSKSKSIISRERFIISCYVKWTELPPGRLPPVTEAHVQRKKPFDPPSIN